MKFQKFDNFLNTYLIDDKDWQHFYAKRKEKYMYSNLNEVLHQPDILNL